MSVVNQRSEMMPRVHPGKPTPVSTILTASERQRVDAAASGLYKTIHRTSVDDVIRDLRENKAGAVLMSVSCCGDRQLARMANLVREFPRVPAVALLTEAETTSAQRVLSLGQSGVRTLIDLRKPAGWTELRSVLLTTRAQDIQRLALAQLMTDLRGVHDDCWKFFETLFSVPSSVNTVRQLAKALGVHASTLMSRFYRAGLPSPKKYLAMARLVRAAEMFENPGLSIANVANHLDYSSPQSFGRHVRHTLDISAAELRARYDGEGMLQRFREDCVLPHLAKLRATRPLTSPEGWYVPPKRARRRHFKDASQRTKARPKRSRRTSGL
jgi:AraC-like DNA-binding protein